MEQVASTARLAKALLVVSLIASLVGGAVVGAESGLAAGLGVSIAGVTASMVMLTVVTYIAWRAQPPNADSTASPIVSGRPRST